MARQLVQAAEIGSRPGTETDTQQPLTLVMPIEFERVEELRATLRKPEVSAISQAALERVGTVHSSRFVILQDDDQRWAKLLVIAIFDGAVEDYIEAFARELNMVFNALFRFVIETEDKPTLPVEGDVETFINYVKGRNVPPAGGRTFSAYPGLTALDIYEAARPRHDAAPATRR
jgi:hypothetical protein